MKAQARLVTVAELLADEVAAQERCLVQLHLFKPTPLADLAAEITRTYRVKGIDFPLRKGVS